MNKLTAENLVNQQVGPNVSCLISELFGQSRNFPQYADGLYEAMTDVPDYEDAEPANNWWRSSQDAYIAHRKVYEHWVVSDWMADCLEAQGEKVVRDLFALTIWCRTTTGQAICLDEVIERIITRINSKLPERKP